MLTRGNPGEYIGADWEETSPKGEAHRPRPLREKARALLLGRIVAERTLLEKSDAIPCPARLLERARESQAGPMSRNLHDAKNALESDFISQRMDSE